MSNKYVRTQLVTPGPQGGETRIAATFADLDEHSRETPTGNLPSIYLTRYLAGKWVLIVGVEKAVFGTGLNTVTPGNRVSTVQKGATDAGPKIPHNNAVLADWGRNRDVYIAEYAEQLDEPLYSGEFGATSLPDHFGEVLGNLQEDE